MTLKQYLILMFIGTLMSWGAVGLIVTMVNPVDSPVTVFAVFYFSLAMALTGTFAIISFVSRVSVLKKNNNLSVQVAISFRQSVMLAVSICAILFLQSKLLLTWWNVVLILLAMTILEIFFISISVKNK